MGKNKKGNVIPVGIFIIIFFLMLVLSAVISVAYFYIEAKNRISEIEAYTRGYSIPLAEALADAAELSYKENNVDRIKKIFWEKIQTNIIDEAFFVLPDGTIVVHSDNEIEKKLAGNIATDEFKYNVDLIMMPIWTGVQYAQFMDYHIYSDSDNKRLKIDKRIVTLLRRYLYPKINVSGWLVTKGVYVDKKGVGCISFIISKDRIFKFLFEHYNKTIKLSIGLAGISFLLALFISLIVFIRYRSLRRYASSSDMNYYPCFDTEFGGKKLKEAIRIKQGNENAVKIPESEVNSFKENDNNNIIKDAEPVKDK